ncbi:hypothetical protein KY332_00180 [Candidatus Woesearchaeota archaeon]|nr:hypothetical protein [Candidatus Woesearchaeota archaeon]
MKYALIILILLASFAYAEKEVFDKHIDSNDEFTVNYVDYSFSYSFTSDKALIKSKYSKLILPMEECKEAGYLKFCLISMTNDTEEENTEFRLIINETDCIEYQLENASLDCKVKIGEDCTSDYMCVGKCLHGTCTISYPICGDGYCDKNDCEEDCKVEVNETVVNETVEEAPEPELFEENELEAAEPEVVEEISIEEEKKSFDKKKLGIWISISVFLLGVAALIYQIYKKRKENQFA